MNNILIKTRDELICIDVDSVAYLKAAGNYTEMFYIYSNGKPVQIPKSISALYTELKKHNNRRNFFLKLGRSYVVNDLFLRRIKTDNKPTLFLGDSIGNQLRIEDLSKQMLNAYKEARFLRVEMKTKRTTSKNTEENVKN